MENKVDAVLIAGDIYDRSVPIAEAVCALDDFLNALCDNGIALIAIAGTTIPRTAGIRQRLMSGAGYIYPEFTAVLCGRLP